MYTKITENFRWYEFFRSNVARRNNINNIPSDQIIYDNIQLLTKNILQPARNKFGAIRITSGYRNEELNKLIGGSVYSNHCKGQAADIEPLNDNISMLDIVLWIHNNCDYRELICEYWPDGWIHVDYREGANNKQLKIKDDQYNYDKVSIDTVLKKYEGFM